QALRVQKEGHNKGRLFLRCDDRACDSFEWASPPPAGLPTAPAAPAEGAPARHTTEEGILADVREYPDDDAPRLIYADWLDDHGQHERAELVRVQCELARATTGGPALLELRRREGELLGEHGAAWAAPVAEVADEYAFRRGLPEHLALHAEAF